MSDMLASTGARLYLGVVAVTATVALLPSHYNLAAYLLLIAITLPISPILIVAMFIVGSILAPYNDSLLIRTLDIAVWILAAGFQIWILRSVRAARRT
jgi:hypothetical protein